LRDAWYTGLFASRVLNVAFGACDIVCGGGGCLSDALQPSSMNDELEAAAKPSSRRCS